MTDDKQRNSRKYLRVLLTVLAALMASGAVACAVCYAVLRLDVLFIPIALCAVAGMILFTYSRYVKE